MANQEDRELELALALSAKEERERQEKLRGSDQSKQRQAYQPLRSSPYQVTGRPYAPSEAHQAHHMRNLTMSDPNAPLPSDSNITPIYVPAPPAAQVAPFYATTLYNPFAPPPYSGTTASPIAQWQPPPTPFYPNYSGVPPQYAYQPPPGAYPPPPGYSPAPPPIDPFTPPRAQTQPPSVNVQTAGAVPMPPPVVHPVPYVPQPQHPPQATLAAPLPAGPTLRVSSPSSPGDSPASVHGLGTSSHQVAPLSALLPPSSPGVARAPSPSRPKPLMRETTTLEMALTVTNSLGLIRVPVPGDGACLFRAVSERLFGTQRRHRFVRRACVHYMERHAEDFRVFIEGSGYKFGDYIEMMRQETSWGGQIELQSMSMVFSVDFAIYSAKHDPVFVENGFRRYVALWFSHGSHYDVLYPMPEFSKITVAQELVYWLIERTFNPTLPFRPSFNYKYRNVEMERYEAHVRRREEKDHNLAAQLMSDEKKIDYLRVQQGGDHDVARRLQEEEEDARLARALQLSLGTTAEPTVIRGEHHHSGKKDKKTSPRSPRGEKHGFLDRIKEILPGGHSDKDRARAKSPSGRDDLRSGGYH